MDQKNAAKLEVGNEDDTDKCVVCVLETLDPFSNVTWKKYVDFLSPLKTGKYPRAKL